MGFAGVQPLPGRRVALRRRPDVLALGGLLLGAAVILLVAVLFPMSDQAPVGLGWVMFATALAMTTLTLAAGDRLPPAALAGQAAVAALLNGVLVAASHTTAGAMGDGIAFVWLAVYVAAFFPRIAAPFALFEAAVYGAGLLVADLESGMFTGWAVLSLSTLMLAVVLGAVSAGMRRRMRTDPLTGVLNREGLQAAAERVCARTRRRDDALSIAVLDLDDFKQVNDTGGHAAGDRLLTGATAAWRQTLRAEDVLARTGGDEFVLLLPGTREDEVPLVLRRLQEAHAVPWSVGVTQWSPGEPLEACLERADLRLYEAKRAAR
jgi:diguanylate cyclase (GGDEF)-like protein